MAKKIIICNDCKEEIKRGDSVEEYNGDFYCKDCYRGIKKKI